MANSGQENGVEALQGGTSQPAFSFLTDRPVGVSMVFLALGVFGLFSLLQLPLTLMPDLNYPTLTVRTEYPGTAPEEVENEVSRPIEEALGVVSGLSRISSASRAGISDVILEFTWGTDMSEAAQDVLEKLDLVFLPEDAEKPLILRFDPKLDPIVELSLSGSGERFAGEEGLRRLRRIAELQIKRQLEPIKGVAAVRIRGGLEEEVHVLLDGARLQAAGLGIRQVIERLRQENINLAGGTVVEGRAEYMVRTLNEFTDLEQIAQTVLKREGNKSVRLADVGSVAMGQKDRELVTRVDGNESVQIDIYKEADANLVRVAQELRLRVNGTSGYGAAGYGAAGDDAGGSAGRDKAAGGLAAGLLQQEGVQLSLAADRSTFVRSAINDLAFTVVVGGLLAVLVLFLFLRQLQPTAIIAVSIPLSLLMAFIALHLLGVSLNIMTLGGLALGIGSLVDSSIVVLESIFRCREEGDSIRTSALRGTAEVRAAVTASILTNIAVFFPMIFIAGLAGQVFRDLGIAVVASQLASLLVALFYIPMLASRGGPAEHTSAGLAQDAGPDLLRFWHKGFPRGLFVLPISLFLMPWFLLGRLLRLLTSLGSRALILLLGPLAAATLWLIERLQNRYRLVLMASLRRPWLVMLLSLLCLGLILIFGRRLNSELMPEVRQGEFTFDLSLPVGTPLEKTAATFSRVEEAVLANRQAMKAVIVSFGFDVRNMQRSDEGEHSAKIKVLLEDRYRSPAAEDAVVDRLRRLLEGIPDLNFRVVRPVLFTSNAPLEVEIAQDNLTLLRRLAEQSTQRLSQLSELADVETTLKAGAPEVEVVYDREQLMRFGLNLREVAEQVRDLVKGYEATRYNLKDRRIPLVVRLNDAARENLDQVRNLHVGPLAEQPIPLAAVAHIQLGEGPSEVRRLDGRRIALVRANLGQASLSEAVARIEESMAGLTLPEGTAWRITGQNREWQESRLSLLLAFLLSVFLVYIIMAAQFEDLAAPLLILLTIPLALLGCVMALYLLGLSLSVMALLGIILLCGIVVNNAIVLIDYIKTLCRRGMALREAIIEAGMVRLRPILMTTLTTVLGLLPMALGFGDGAELRTPMAITVIAGLVVSTLLTLVLIPVLYQQMQGRKPGAVRQGASTPGEDLS